jgi:hypothetical protein
MWPDPEERLLLRAAVLGGEPDAPIWDELRRHLPTGANVVAKHPRLAPLLWTRLNEAKVAWPDEATMKTAYVHTWAANQLRVNRATEAASALEAQGIESLLLKGIAVLLMYPSLGARPMADIDIIVREKDFDTALQVLATLGWKQSFSNTEAERRFGHAGLLTDEGGNELDLHWRLAPDTIVAPQVEEFWRSSSYRDFGPRRAKVPAPTYQLFHCLSHGLRWSKVPSLQWVADASFIVANEESNLEWDRLIDLADLLGRGTVVRQGLRFLSTELGVNVPEGAMRPAATIPRLERREAWFLSHVGPNSKLGGLPDRWYFYRRVSGRLDSAVGPRGFWHYLRWRWAPHGGLVRTAYSKIAERIAGPSR